MITITFQATTAENLIRQMVAFIEKTEGGKANGPERKGKTPGKRNTDLAEERE